MKTAVRKQLRKFAAIATLGVALAVAVVFYRAPRLSAKAATASLVHGRDYLVALRNRLEQPLAGRDQQSLRVEALQAIYLARIEARLGSPFRTIEAALRDPWLPDSVRGLFATGLLAQTLSAEAPAAARFSVDSITATLVDSAVRAQSDPRRGEEVVRVAFDLAVGAGAVSQSDALAAVELAAVSRDAAFARRDVARLVVAAHRSGSSPLDLLPIWRAERRFEVEEPIVYASRWATSRDLIARAAELFEILDSSKASRQALAADSQRRELLDINASLRQAARRLATERGGPPSPAILQIAAGVPMGRLVPPAANEEELGAAWLSVRSLTRNEQRAWARAFVSASVRLRTTAQDVVWFAGDKVPRVVDLQERHGIRAITFPNGFRPAWRDYTLQAVDRALSDTRRVFPDIDYRGLRIHIGVKADWPARAMALHDPESRTIYFPLVSAPGVFAHELGHDLDWQVARSVFGEYGIYATDGTARRSSELLAAPVGRLTGASAIRSKTGRGSTSIRPTEVLARHVDWLVAAGLASMGRSNGFLSTIQDGGDALGNTLAPERGQVDAAVSVISAATRVPVGTVAQIHAAVDEEPLVRNVVSRALSTSIRMPWTRRAASPIDAIGSAPAIFRQAADPRLARRCVAEAARVAGEPDWVADVYALVADARSRDVLRRLQNSATPARRVSTHVVRAGLAPGPIDPTLREQSLIQLRRDIEWQLAEAMLSPLAQASAVAVCD